MIAQPSKSDDATARPVGHPPRDAIGIDLGGSKIEVIRITANGAVTARRRIATPQHDYAATVQAVCELVAAVELTTGVDAQDPARTPIGIGIPGSLSKRTGLVRNANSTWLNGRDLQADLTTALNRSVAITNDANCFALSEAVDGAAASAHCVLGVIIGTGTGSGLVINGQIIDGPLGITGEIGHNPLPSPDPKLGEMPGLPCWCGRTNCIETWVSGPALSADHARATGSVRTAREISDLARDNDQPALATLERHADRLARGLAAVVNVIDPDVIVLGGGLSQLDHLYERLPALMRPYVFCDDAPIEIRRPKWGDASGVRGAALLAATSERSIRA